MPAEREVIEVDDTRRAPASSIARRTSAAVRGVALAGLTMLVQPAAIAGPSLRVIIAAGKFQGVIAAVTPTGWRSTSTRFRGFWRGDDLAVDALGLAGEPLEEARGVLDLAGCLGERLALLGGHHGGDRRPCARASARRRGAGSGRARSRRATASASSAAAAASIAASTSARAGVGDGADRPRRSPGR